MLCAIYARVSTDDQSCDLQLRILREYCAERKWTIFKEYVDEGVSGSKTSRPAFDQMKRDARKKQFQTLLVWKFDRFARSLLMLVEALVEFRKLGIDFVSSTQQIDTTTAAGRAFFNMIGTFAEFEREMIAERVAAGVKRYAEDFKAGKVGEGAERQSRSGKNLAPHRPEKVFDRQACREMRAAGVPFRTIADRLNVSLGAVQRALRAPIGNVSKAA